MPVSSGGVPLGRVTARQGDGLVWLGLAASAVAGGVVTWFVTGSGTDSSALLAGSICMHGAWLARLSVVPLLPQGRRLHSCSAARPWVAPGGPCRSRHAPRVASWLGPMIGVSRLADR